MKHRSAKNPLSLRVLLWAGVVLAAVLGCLFLKAASHLREITETLTQLEGESQSLERQFSALGHEVDDVGEDIAAIIGGRPASVDEVRRNANLAVIAQLKSAHEAHPPAPRKLPPPVPTNGGGGIIFPELINDSEYRSAFLIHSRARLRRTKLPELLRLGLSEEAGEKSIAVLAEHEAAIYDYHQLSGNKGPAIPGVIAKNISEDTNNQLRQIMGEEIYKRYEALNASTEVTIPRVEGSRSTYNVPSHEALVARARDQYIFPLITRLSYSDNPLQLVQAEQLAELLATMSAASLKTIPGTMYSDSFTEEASKILSASQLSALRQLQGEQQASEKRSKLPKSSELPRNAPVLK